MRKKIYYRGKQFLKSFCLIASVAIGYFSIRRQDRVSSLDSESTMTNNPVFGERGLLSRMDVAFSSENDVPIVVNPILNQKAHHGSSFNMDISFNTFRDPGGRDLEISVKQKDDSPLPAWISDHEYPLNPHLVGEGGGGIIDVNVLGNYAYVVSNVGLRVIDISNPNAPTQISSLNTSYVAVGICVAESYAFLIDDYTGAGPLDDWRGLKIIDVSNPSTPSLISTLATSSGAVDICIHNNYAFVADKNSGVKIIDISNPYSPTTRKAFSTGGWVVGLDVVENYLYLVDGSFRIFDVSDPLSPKQIGYVGNIGINVAAIHVAGAYAYVADDYDPSYPLGDWTGLKIFDVNNPYQPEMVSTIVTPGRVKKIQVVGNYAFIADGNAGLTVINISAPLSPRIEKTLNIGDGAEALQIIDDFAFIAGFSKGLKIVGGVSPKLRLSGVPSAADYKREGINLKAIASDGTSSVECPFSIIFVNQPPVLEHPFFNQTAHHKTPFGFKIPNDTFFDPDADPITLEMETNSGTDLPGWLIFDSSRAILSGVPALAGDVGNLEIRATASDGVDSISFTFSINVVNLAPIISRYIPNSLVYQGESINREFLQDTFKDGDGNKLSLIVKQSDDSDLPSWIIQSKKQIDMQLQATVESQGGLNMAITKNFIFVANEICGLSVFDISNPLEAKLLGTYLSSGSITNITLRDSFILIAVNPGKFEIVDVSDFTSIQLLSSVEVGGTVNSIELRNNFIYIANGPGGIKIIDISDVGNPSVKTSYTTNNALVMQIVDEMIFLADGEAGIKIFLIDQTGIGLEKIGEISLGGTIKDVAVLENNLFVASGTEGLKVIDISAPINPRIISTLEISGNAQRIKIEGIYAYLAMGDGGIAIVNIDDPNNPQMAYVTMYEDVRDVIVKGDYAFVSDYNQGLKIIGGVGDGIILKGTPQEEFERIKLKVIASDGAMSTSESFFIKYMVNNRPEISTYFQSYSIEIKQPLDLIISTNAFTDRDNDFLSILAKQVNGPLPSWLTYMVQFEELSSLSLAEGVKSIRAVTKDDADLVFLLQETELKIVDASDGYNPTVVGSYSLSGQGVEMEVTDKYLYLLDSSAGFQILNIVDLSNPTVISSIDALISAFSLVLHENYVYIANGNEGLKIIDISYFSNPNVIGSCATNGLSTYVIAADTKAFVITQGVGLQIIDTSDVANPWIISSLETDTEISKASLEENYVFLSIGDGGIIIVDYSDLFNPKNIGSLVSAGNVTDISVIGDFAYINDSIDGLKIIDVSDKNSPIFMDHSNVKNIQSFTIPQKGYKFYVGESNLFRLMCLKQYKMYGAPAEDCSKNYYITVTAKDPLGESISTTFEIRVEGPPKKEKDIPSQYAKVSRFFNYFFPLDTFSDPNNDMLTFSANMADMTEWPSWLSFNSLSATFTGTPPDSAVGVVNIKIVASDRKSGEAEALLSLAIDHNPELKNPIGNLVANISCTFNYTIPANTFEDKDVEDELSYSATRVDGTVLPDWLQFHDTTRRLEGIPQEEDERELQIRVTVDDGKEGTESTTLRILTEHFPQVTETIESQLAGVGESYSLSFGNKFRSPDSLVLRFTATKTDDSALPRWMEVDVVNGKITGIPSSSDVIDDLQIKIIATDELGGTVFTTFNLTVDHFPEVLTPMADRLVNVNSTLNYLVPAETFVDQDVEDLELSATLVGGSALPNWVYFNSTTNTFLLSPQNSDTKTIKVVATDPKGGFTSTTFQVTAEQFPIILEHIPFQLVPIGNVYSLSIGNKFVSPEESELRFTATKTDDSALPRWMEFDSINGKITGVPQASDVIDNLQIKITATDELGGFVSTSFNLTVDHFPEVQNTIANKLANVGDVFSFTISDDTFRDLDGEDLTITVTQANGETSLDWVTYNTTTKTLTGIPTESKALTLKVIAEDEKGGTVDTTFTITTERFPILQGTIANQEASVGDAFSYNLGNQFISPERDILIFHAEQNEGNELPGWLSFETNTCTFKGTPQAVDLIQDMELAVIARDTLGGSITAVFNMTVRYFPHIKKTIPDQTAIINQAYRYKVSADTFEDLSGRVLTYQARLSDEESIPDWLHFNPTEIEFSGTPPLDRTGNSEIKLTATNGQDSIATIFAINVLANRAPFLMNQISALRIGADVFFEYTIPDNTFSDPQGDSLEYRIILTNPEVCNQSWPFSFFEQQRLFGIRPELENGLPFWLQTNMTERQISGTAPNWAASMSFLFWKKYKTYTMKVEATDGLTTASTFFDMILGGPALTEIILNTLFTALGMSSMVLGIYGQRYILLNKSWFKTRYQKPNQEISIDSEDELEHFIEIPVDRISEIKVLTYRGTKKVELKGVFLPKWFSYDETKNAVIADPKLMTERNTGIFTIQIIDKSNILQEQFDIRISDGTEEEIIVSPALPQPPKSRRETKWFCGLFGRANSTSRSDTRRLLLSQSQRSQEEPRGLRNCFGLFGNKTPSPPNPRLLQDMRGNPDETEYEGFEL